MQNETAQLTLRTFDISPTNNVANNTDNGIGRITANNARITFKNINLRHILGPMWENYTKFNMILKFYGIKPQNAISVGDRTMSMWISGLNFSNQTYDIRTKGLSQDACIGIVQYNNANTDGIAQPFLDNVITINKTEIPIVDITIEFKCQTTTVVDGFSEKPSVVMGHHTFGFIFVGCEDYKISDVKRRI